MHLGAPGHHGDVVAFVEHFGFRQRQGVVLYGHVLDRLPIQDLRLEEYHRIRVAYARQQQALGLYGRTRYDHLNARTVGEKGLDTLRVIQGAVTDCTRGRTDG